MFEDCSKVLELTESCFRFPTPAALSRRSEDPRATIGSSGGRVRNSRAAEPSPHGPRVHGAHLRGAASGSSSSACGAGLSVCRAAAAMAPRIWRRRALERCLGAVRKATGRPESFLT